MRRWPLAFLAVALLPCSCVGPGSAPRPSHPMARAVPTAPGPLTVVSDTDPVAAAVASSRALFRSSDVVVVARAGDLAGTLAGASAAVTLGVPLLLRPTDGPQAGLDDELHRLHTRTELAVGTAGSGDAPASSGNGVRVLEVPADRAALTAAGVRLGATVPVAADGTAQAIAGLRRGAADALRPEVPGGTRTARASGGTAGSPSGKVPQVTAAPALRGTTVLATGAPETWAGVATARAAGARVDLTGGTADPRASSAVVADLAKARPSSVLALGAGFAGRQGLAWQLATAATGRQLPGGGQLLFPGRTLVAMYGSPGSPALGVLGEQDIPASITRAEALAASYRPLVPGPVVPTFEIIATVASDAPGPDGNYSTELDPAVLMPWVQAAAEAGVYVVLDLQPGRSDFLDQAQRYESLLRMPNVGLALDPEWRLTADQRPLAQIGSVGIDEINRVVTWLADLTQAQRLPQKLLVLHQFRTTMIQGRDRLDTSRQELAVTLHADGQGDQGNKQSTWAALHQDLPAGPLFWGWKNFYDEDHPMLTPDQTIGQVHPTPQLISYQ